VPPAADGSSASCGRRNKEGDCEAKCAAPLRRVWAVRSAAANTSYPSSRTSPSSCRFDEGKPKGGPIPTRLLGFLYHRRRRRRESVVSGRPEETFPSSRRSAVVTGGRCLASYLLSPFSSRTFAGAAGRRAPGEVGCSGVDRSTKAFMALVDRRDVRFGSKEKLLRIVLAPGILDGPYEE
jgi:hypothetical protein